MEDINENFGIEMNFIEYASISPKLNAHFDCGDIPDYLDFRPHFSLFYYQSTQKVFQT